MVECNTLQVLICDDDGLFLSQITRRIKEILEDAQIHANIVSYDRMDAVPAGVIECCDLAFLDVDFCEEWQTGIDLAHMIRSVNQKAIIIFISNYIEYAPEGYEVQAFRFVIKSEVPQKLEQYVLQAIAKRESVRQTITITVAGESKTVLLSNILYMEAQGHTVLLHLLSGNSLRFYASIGKLEQDLEKKGFLRIHKGFLVNMAHIQHFKSAGILLTDGSPLPVSEKNYAEQKKKYLLWKGRQ